MPATAANIPPELFEYILQVLTLPEDVQTWSADFVRAEKREIGQCALVCKYWASLCQERLFRNTTLRSREDVYQLLEFCNCPISHVSRHVWDIAVSVQTRPSVPWLHLLPLLTESLSPLVDVDARLEGPQPVRGALRSIHHGLPKTLPPSFSSSFRMITITNVQFRRFSDLVHLLTELRNLRDLECTTVTWSGDPPFTPRVPSKHGFKNIRSVKMHGCTSDWMAIWVLVKLQLSKLDKIAQDQCIDLLTSLQDIHHTLSEKWTDCAVEAIYVFDDVDYGVSCRGHLGDSQSPAIELGASISHSESGTFHLSISIDISVPFEDFTKCAWSPFDEYISSHKEIRKVIFGFRSKDDMTRFIKDVATPDMPRLLESGKVVYAIRRDCGHGAHNEKWAYASPKSDALIDSGAYNLYEL